MNKTEAQLSDLQLAVYDRVRSAGWGGVTVDEVEVALNKSHQSVSARMHELEKFRLVERRSARRPTRSGRKAFIFVAYGLKRANEETP